MFLCVCFLCFSSKRIKNKDIENALLISLGHNLLVCWCLVKFKHRDCVSQLTEFTETLKLVRFKRIIHLEMKILSSLTYPRVFLLWNMKGDVCIMCELLFSNDTVIAFCQPALDGKVQHSVINNDRCFTFG